MLFNNRMMQKTTEEVNRERFEVRGLFSVAVLSSFTALAQPVSNRNDIWHVIDSVKILHPARHRRTSLK